MGGGLAAHVAMELADKPYTSVIYHFLDNYFYFSQSEDGSKRPAKKGLDGGYHFEGDVVLADKDGQFGILKLCEPLWEVAKGKNMVVVGPMARFITGSCCEDSTHAANRNNTDFYNKMMGALRQLQKQKKTSYSPGLSQRQDYGPGESTAGPDSCGDLGQRPIHPKADIYNFLAKSVIQVELTCGSGQSKCERSQRDGSDNFGGHGGGGGPGGTGAHGGVSHGHQPVRARGDGVGPPMGGRGHRGHRGWGDRGAQWREGPASGRRPSRRPGGSHYRW